MKLLYHFMGEFIGTFLLVLFGCGSVAVTVLFSAHMRLFQVAMIWGLGVTIAIYATRHLSCAHLNPAVSIAMVAGRRMSASKLPVYLCAQFIGAFAAAATLYLLFGDSIVHFESLNHILRGSPASVKTAMMFGEFYPHPGAGVAAIVAPLIAFFAEATGTFSHVFLIFSSTVELIVSIMDMDHFSYQTAFVLCRKTAKSSKFVHYGEPYSKNGTFS